MPTLDDSIRSCPNESNAVQDCAMKLLRAMERTLQLLFVVFSISHFCKANVRLVGGNATQGRVEVFYNGQWGTVCDDYWDLNDANVVCRSLGLPRAVAALRHAAFCQGTGPIWMDDIHCSGSESSLFQCQHRGWGSHNCGHYKDASVVCELPTMPLVQVKITNLTGEITSTGYPYSMHMAYYEWTFWPPIPRAYVFVNITDIDLFRSSGFSYLKVEDATNTQFFYAWNNTERSASALIETTTGKLTYFSSFTSKRGSTGKGFLLRYHTFSMPENDQGCNENWNVSLIQNDPGRINVSWCPVPSHLPGSTYTYFLVFKMVKTIESNVTTLNDSSRTARIEFLHPNRTYSIRLVAFDTSVDTVIHSCSQLIKTLDVSLRLAGGKLSNEGRVEVLYHGIWGSICTYRWDLNDGNVVCRSLGLPAASQAMRYGQFGRALSGTTWMTELSCSGNEESLALCPHRGWRNIPSYCSGSYYTASVVCGYPQELNFNITDLSGEFTSPGFPHYMLQAHYVWTFRPSLPNANIAIFFEVLDLYRSYYNGQSYVNVKDSSGHQLFYLSYTRASPLGLIIQNHKTGQMTFYSPFTTSYGKGIRVRYLVFDRSLNDALTQNAFILASSTSPHSISVSIGSFTVDGFKVLGYLITCNSTDDWHRIISYAIAGNMTKNASCHRLVGLTNYKVQVFAVVANITDGSMMMYKSNPVEIKTLEGVPSDSPRGFYAVSSTSSTIHVQWNPIPRDRAHGVLLGYQVYYYDYEYYHSKTITTNKTQVVLEHLLPGMRYYIRVRGFTSKGQGPSITIRPVTKCGGVEHQALGKMSHPRYNIRHWWAIDCVWTLRAPSRTGMIVISLESVDVPNSSQCWWFFVALFDNKGQMIEKMCGRRHSLTFIFFGTAKLQSHSQRWLGRDIFTMKAKYYMFNNGLYDVPVKSTWNISAKSDRSSTINVQWSEYPLSSNIAASTQVVSYVAVCIAVKNHTDISVASPDGQGRSVNVTHLRSNTEYYVQVIAVLGNSSNTTSANETTFQRSENITVRTMEEVPSQPPVNIVAQVKTSDNILVKWDPIPSEYAHGILLGYHVYYTPTLSSNTSHERMEFVDANRTSVTLQNLGFLTEYRIRVAGVNQAGEGPRSRAVFVRTGLDCDKNLYGKHGHFSSPNFPSNYPSDANCAWTIGKGMKFNMIIILFDLFELEEETYGMCSNDHVRIVDIKGNALGKGKYCGKTNPFAVVSPLRSAEVILYSDRAFEKIGFNGTYYVIDKRSNDIDLKVKSVTTTELMLDIKDLGVKFTELLVIYKEKEGKKTWKVSTTSSSSFFIQGLLPSKKYQARALGYSNGRVYKSQLVTIVTKQLPITSPTEKTTPPTTEPLKQMYDYGPSTGDSVVPHTWGELQKCFGVHLNDGVTIFMKRYHKLYICHNGVIRFGAHFFPRWPKPFSRSTEGCKHELAMLAPYWATTDPYSFYQPKISAVYYQLYTSSQQNAKSNQVLNRATSEVNRLYKDPLPEEFQASLVLVVTWYNLRHLNLNSETRDLYNTFQAVIITDGVYTFAMYNYPPNGIQWSAPIASAKWPLYTKGNRVNDPLPVVGWSAGCDQYEYFNVSRSGEVTIGDIGTMPGQTVSRKRGGGGGRFKKINHGVQGKWLFRLEMSSGQSSERNCKLRFKSEPDPRPYLEYLEPCPCTFFQARWDERFMVQDDWRDKSRVCAYSTFTSIDGWQQKCCYFNDWRSNGALIVGHPGGGSALREKYDKNPISNENRFYEWCCVQTTMCHLYYQRRPSDDCKQYEPPEWSWFWGDPHFVTLDGKNYTFNGLGEYAMLDAKDGFVQVQARTRLAKGDGTATVFCAVVAQERNTSKVQVNLEREGNFTLFVDGETLDYYSLTNQSTRLNGSVVVSRPKDNIFRATFPSGISLTVTEVKGALSILIAMPKSFRNQTKGLLGTWNGNQTDDLTTPSGDVLPADASSRDIHFQFGQKWQVNESTSLFTYQFGDNVSTFSNTSFVPMFIDELKFYNESLKKKAEAACQGDINCLFDSASTKDVSVGLSTKIVGSQMVNESNILKNSPPEFDNTSSVLYLTVNVSNSVTFTANDLDGDRIRFNITGPPEDATVWTNESSITMEWMVTTNSVKLEIIATDNKGATSVLRPVLHVCACHNNGDCLTSNQEEENRNNSRFSIMSCQCPSGYTGRFCESDIDACEVNMNPCYPGVQCKDLPAPANVTGYECGPCPSGFSGQGDSCSDIDECDGFSQTCTQICANTPGSFTCGCNDGYVLNGDGRTCDDVNECDPASDCMQGCVNTPGSYRCTCDKYFTVDPTNPKRCIPEAPCKDGNHQCKHICYVSNGTDHCTCRPGYELQHDNKSCSDIDECTTGKNRCNQDCRNTIGWYDCECRPGYRLDTDNVTCVDIDECLEWTFSCSANMRCRNKIGSYECECRQGLVWNGIECQEPDKPATTRPPSTPRPPSEKDIQNSVNVTVQGLNITEAFRRRANHHLHSTRSSSSARLPSAAVFLVHP
ncbi:uncharacterized protein LOC116304951 isoform X2 [Actinia tenebrosa]|uniref:Uncharacterized protein LOC116304951 isoform X2 n=1 Tax=Actinia tenebrosa TaxID=6105 RepID=A0A6P8IUM3_ACTTE|nr:uncharacterized protein LOC116304951 isoform X2 [Actinia tenebrosa]